MYKADDLRYAVYARHGDMCSLAPHCKELGCASRLASDDFVLVARFAYLTEAIDYAQMVGTRGVTTHLRSQRYGSKAFDVSVYPKDVASKPAAIAEHVAGAA